MQGLPRRYLLMSLVYAGAVLLVICLAVFAGSLSRTVGGARISGRFSPFPLFNRSNLEELTLSWNGLNMRFSRASLPADGTGDIMLAGNERLHIVAGDAAGPTLTISPEGSSAADAGVFSIPFKVMGVLQDGSDARTLSWRQGADAFQLTLPPNSTIDYPSRSIEVQLGGAAPGSEMKLVSLSPAAASQAFSAEAPAPAPRLPDEKSLPTQDQLDAALGHFSDSAYAGWRTSRYSAEDKTWRMADGKQGFVEEIGTAFLAESVARGTFSNAIQAWVAAVDNRVGQSPRLSYSTCVYTGQVKDFARLLQDKDAGQADRLKGLASRGDPTLLSQPGILVYALDRGGPLLAKSILSTLRALDAAQMTPPALLTDLESQEDYLQLVGDDAAVPPAARELVEKWILPSVATTTNGAVFFAPQRGVDVMQSIRCGSLLIRAGSLLQESKLAALGRALIVSSLSLASDDGLLPASLTVSSGRVVSQAGALAPESVYAMLPLERHLPHEVPLYRLMGVGCWVWTASELISADDVGGEIRLVFAYPAEVPQHLVFRGLAQFQQIRMHGILWHSDPSYAKYSDGWDYDPQTQTLFMKITGKKDKEEVGFTF